MTAFLGRVKAEWALRLAFAAMYFYSSLSIIRHPGEWEWAMRQLPNFIQGLIDGIGLLTFLRVQGVVELLFALCFVAWFLPRRAVAVVAGLAALEMLSILVMVGVDSVTFRDFGILGGLIALALLLYSKQDDFVRLS